MALASRPQTTIRMGAAHYDLTVVPPAGPVIELDLTKARWPDKTAMAEQLCAAYGITGPKQHHHPRRPKRSADANARRGKPTHQSAGQLPGEEPIRPAPALDGPKKRSRRRRTPRPVSASGPTAN